MKYLVTGASGVVGKYLVKELIKQPNITKIVGITRSARYFYDAHPYTDDYTGIFSDCNNTKYIECYADLLLDQTRLITQYRPDIIIHAAGEGRQNVASRDIWRGNVDTTINLLEACTKLDYQPRFIYCSSIMVNINDSIYAISKRAGESLLSSYRQYIDGIFVRFPAVAGAGNKHGVVSAVVKKLIEANDFPFSPHINLLSNSRKPFIYAGELAFNLINAHNINKSSSGIQLCSTDSITVENIAKLAMQITGIKKDIQWGESWKGDVSRISPIKSCVPVRSSEDAVRLGIQDILEDYNYVK